MKCGFSIQSKLPLDAELQDAIHKQPYRLRLSLVNWLASLPKWNLGHCRSRLQRVLENGYSNLRQSRRK